MNFDQAFEKLIGHEGRYSNRSPADDPGGETMYGISKRSYPNEDIKNMTLARAKTIYLHDFWAQSGCELVPFDMKFDLFDAGVHHGQKTARKLLQHAACVTPDGVIGPNTLMAVQSCNSDRLRRRFNAHRLVLMAGLDNWDANSEGWTRRVAANMLED